MTPLGLKTTTPDWEKIESEEIRPNIFIPTAKANPNFNRDVKVLIDRIETNPIGQRLFEKISKCSSQIYIHSDSYDHADWEYSKEEPMCPVFIGFAMQDLSCFSTKAELIPLPKHVILVHELIHAYHYLSGKLARSRCCDPLVWGTFDEEYKTIVGFPSKKAWKKTAKITENAFRRAEGLPERFGHFFSESSEMISDLCAARIRILGLIHERNQEAHPDDLSPPPVALCSVADLGLRTYTMSRITFCGRKRRFSTLHYDISTDLFDDGCYIRISGFAPEQLDNGRTVQQQEKDHRLNELFATNKQLQMTQSAAEKLVRDIWPQPTLKELTVESMTYIRCSQEEVDIFNGHGPKHNEKSSPKIEIPRTLKIYKDRRFLGGMGILGILVILGILGLRGNRMYKRY